MELINGDCLEKMKDISDNSIALLFCDLPYGQTSCKWDSLIDLELFWKEVNRICKITTPMFFTCSTKFGVSLINSNPKNFRYDLVWVKSSPCGFLNAKKMPMKKHEMIYVFYRKLPFYDLSSHKHKFLRERKEEWCDKNGLYGEDKEVPKTEINTGDKGNQIYNKFSYYNNGEKGYDPPLPNSLLEIKSEKGKHATQKPRDLIKWCLKYYSKEGDLILDPTMGSGSTGVACKEMNRNFIGIEKDEKIFNVAVERIKKILFNSILSK
jgi:site-specific DNA-methyltransferase (adenine-specific)